MSDSTLSARERTAQYERRQRERAKKKLCRWVHVDDFDQITAYIDRKAKARLTKR